MHELPNGRAVLITGGGSGIGRSCVARSSESGWKVYAGVRTKADAQAFGRQAPPNVVRVQLDITNPVQIQRALRQVMQETGDGTLRALVNNAGISIPGPLECVPLQELRKQLEVNLVGRVGVICGSLCRIETRTRRHLRRTQDGASPLGHPRLDRGTRGNRHTDLEKTRARAAAMMKEYPA